MNIIGGENLLRVQRCLDYIRDNPDAHYPGNWADGVRKEAREIGLLPPLELESQVGACCRPGIDRGIVYGGDMEDVF